MAIKNFKITNYQDSPSEDRAIALLLNRTFVAEGYTDAALAKKLLDPNDVKKRGDIILAQSPDHELLGMVICTVPPNPACRVAKSGEVEVQLFAIDPQARGQGIASALIEASEQHAHSLGFTKMVLSTQPTMRAAHKVYERHGYQRNSSRDWKRDETTFLVYEKMISKKQSMLIK